MGITSLRFLSFESPIIQNMITSFALLEAVDVFENQQQSVTVEGFVNYLKENWVHTPASVGCETLDQVAQNALTLYQSYMQDLLRYAHEFQKLATARGVPKVTLIAFRDYVRTRKAYPRCSLSQAHKALRASRGMGLLYTFQAASAT